MNKFIAIAACAALAGASAVSAQEPSTQTQAEAQSAPAKPAKPKKICKREVPTGSMLPRSSCHTQQEWDAYAAAGEDSLKQLRDRSGSTMGAIEQ